MQVPATTFDIPVDAKIWQHLPVQLAKGPTNLLLIEQVVNS